MIDVTGLETAIFGLIAFGVGYVPVKKLSSTYGASRGTLLILIFQLIPLLSAIYLMKPLPISEESLIISAISGIFSGLGYLFFLKMLESEYLSSTSGLFAVQPLILLLFGVVVLAEPITALNLLGVLIILIGIWFVTNQKGIKINKPYLFGILAYIFWAVFLIILNYTLQGSNQIVIQLAVARVASILLLLGYVIYSSTKKKVPFSSNGIMLSIFAGVLIGIGTLEWASLLTINFVALGSVVIGMWPILLAILGYFIYKEKPKPIQIFGVILAIIGAILIGL